MEKKRYSDVSLLAPWFRDKLLVLLEDLQDQGYPLKPFETYRTPQRQDWLYAQGRTRPGPKVTNARAWQSFHQYGVAVDLVFFVSGKWSWEGPWEKAHQVIHEHGFETLSFEKPHIQITGGLTAKECFELSKQGMTHVWNSIKVS